MLIYGNKRCDWGWLHHWEEWVSDRLITTKERLCKKCGAYEIERISKDIKEPEVMEFNRF